MMHRRDFGNFGQVTRIMQNEMAVIFCLIGLWSYLSPGDIQNDRQNIFIERLENQNSNTIIVLKGEVLAREQHLPTHQESTNLCNLLQTLVSTTFFQTLLLERSQELGCPSPILRLCAEEGDGSVRWTETTETAKWQVEEPSKWLSFWPRRQFLLQMLQI
jgi:hypothetical protein